MIRDLYWHTELGAWLPPKVILRNKDLFAECSQWPWMKLLLFALTGREFNEAQIKLCEGIWVNCGSYPDPRIWPNRVAAFAGTVRSTGALGIAASIAVSEAKIYGRRADRSAFSFITSARRAVEEGKELLDFIKTHMEINRGIAGYGRPLVTGDERIVPLMSLAGKLGLDKGPHVQLAFQVERLLQQNRYRMAMNIAVVCASLMADQGFTVNDYYHWTIVSYTAGALPCYIDSLGHPQASFFPMEVKDMRYTGAERRDW
jgi:citrate synthase